MNTQLLQPNFQASKLNANRFSGKREEKQRLLDEISEIRQQIAKLGREDQGMITSLERDIDRLREQIRSL